MILSRAPGFVVLRGGTLKHATFWALRRDHRVFDGRSTTAHGPQEARHPSGPWPWPSGGTWHASGAVELCPRGAVGACARRWRPALRGLPATVPRPSGYSDAAQGAGGTWGCTAAWPRRPKGRRSCRWDGKLAFNGLVAYGSRRSRLAPSFSRLFSTWMGELGPISGKASKRLLGLVVGCGNSMTCV